MLRKVIYTLVILFSCYGLSQAQVGTVGVNKKVIELTLDRLNLELSDLNNVSILNTKSTKEGILVHSDTWFSKQFNKSSRKFELLEEGILITEMVDTTPIQVEFIAYHAMTGFRVVNLRKQQNLQIELK